MKKLHWALAMVFVLPLLAPSPGFAQGDTSSAEKKVEKVEKKKVKRDPNRITAEEISQLPEVGNAQEVITRLRPRFLQTRGVNQFLTSAPPEPVVYVDEVKRGQIDALRSVPVRTIGEIRYLRGVDATTRWGIGHEAGAILIYTVKPTTPPERQP